MADILSTAISGLEAFQQALSVTGNNISNASTPGYTRQQVNLSPSFAQNFGSGFVGSGVNVDGVSRILDQFANAQALGANQALAQQTAYVGVANQVNDVLGTSSNGIASALTSFYNSLQSLSSNPSSQTLRSSVLAQAQTLAQAINQAGTQLNQIKTTTASQVSAAVDQVNSLAGNIAQLNAQITQLSGQGPNQAPNTLLDQRDQLVSQLSQIVGVRTNTEASGALDIYVGSGQALVVGNQATALSTAPSAYDAAQLDVRFGSGASAQVITGQLAGGSLAGYVQAQSEVLSLAINGLGQIATAVATSVNAQQAQGVTATNTLGGNLFSLTAPTVTAASTNGSVNTFGAITAVVSNVSSLTASNYVLKYSGTAWTATDPKTGAAVPLAVIPGIPATIQIPSGTAPALTLTLPAAGSPSAGDTFLIQPTAGAATGLAVSLTDPNGLAAAGLPVGTAGAANTGTGTISTPTLATPGTLPVGASTINFVTANTYTVTANGTTSAALAYTSNTAITANNLTFTISGAPKAGDSFTIGAPNGVGNDNRNALALASLQTQGVLNGGTVSVASGYSTLVADVGTTTKAATTAQAAQQAVATQATQRQQNISGVNLDEEGAKLVQWQQAYSAAGKVVSVAASLFNTLISDINAG